MTEDEIKAIADSIIEAGNTRILMNENRLLQALLYLVQAEQGTVDNPLLQCRQLLRDVLAKAERRSTRRVPGNPLWVLLSRFLEARTSYRLSPGGWALWLEASNPPETLPRAISSLLSILDMLLAA